MDSGERRRCCSLQAAAVTLLPVTTATLLPVTTVMRYVLPCASASSKPSALTAAAVIVVADAPPPPAAEAEEAPERLTSRPLLVPAAGTATAAAEAAADAEAEEGERGSAERCRSRLREADVVAAISDVSPPVSSPVRSSNASCSKLLRLLLLSDNPSSSAAPATLRCAGCIGTE